jgi:tetrahydromethanopterin S-methyltransferase subunit E
VIDLDRMVNFGLVLFGLGLIVLLGYWMYHLIIASKIQVGIKLALVSMVIGLCIILFSVIKERFKEASSEDVGRKQ